MSATLADLRLRVAGATGPDRALDCAIHKVLVGLKQYEDFYTRADGSICLRYYADPTGPSYYSLPRYTAAVDAALALYRKKPDRIPSDPLKVLADALEQWL